MTWKLFRAKFAEFFKKFPTCAGFQLTTSETQVSPILCKCDACKDIPAGDRVAKMVSEAYSVLKPLGKELQIRTWGPTEEAAGVYEEMLSSLPKGVLVSTKDSLRDFHIWHPASSLIGVGAERQVIEFDCWREYTGWNYFPCYMGDIFAERLRLCRDKGVKRVATRINWGPLINYMFDRPWGNEVNVYLFSELAKDPSQDPDELLRKFVASRYPKSAREAAFHLYKRSTDLQKTWLTFRKGFNADHSRIWNSRSSYIKRIESRLYEVMVDGYDLPPADIAEWRNEIIAALTEAESLVAALGPDVPANWKDELLRGARNEANVAQANADCTLMYRAWLDHKAGRPLPDLDALEKDMLARDAAWRKLDPDGYRNLLGGSNLRMLAELRAAIAPAAQIDVHFALTDVSEFLVDRA